MMEASVSLSDYRISMTGSVGYILLPLSKILSVRMAWPEPEYAIIRSLQTRAYDVRCLHGSL